ncbi:nuclear transport factor 2 family protein [Caballeronia sp. LZ035]|uniref:nuclear transport factor 2 family protein n=1 Tax=Caballeronia sp. LZ035 TaxID=3038568 RepID=UPI00285699CA|nr:nuclear transport factor 2 family protein [Caballeronia sp. LZ035]MDR5762689.1 nuclear transport factor 2 family protein [Caballeronia sp. LZ035]
MAPPNNALIEEFYTAFQRLDAEAMAACYAPDILFQDPAFGVLRGREAGDMWRMLLGRAADFSLCFDSIKSIGQVASARAVARYTYSATGRLVVNEIHARFAIRDGLIAEHTDVFDLWRWSRQALGPSGWLLGWTPQMQHAIQSRARRTLNDYRLKYRKAAP